MKCVATRTLLDVFLRESPRGEFVEAWSKTMGGESELAAVVRTATESLGLQSILSAFDLRGHAAVKSDATAAIGMVHRLGLGEVRHWLWEMFGFSITFVHRKLGLRLTRK